MSKKILIVDDNVEYLEVLYEYLVGCGYDVSQSSNGKDALNKFSDYRPDIVVTDIVMPGTDGIELLLKLREINPEVKIIVMSGGNKGHGKTYLHLAKELGANSILNKPFKLAELLEQIEKL